jgi:hypothetical protein
MMMSKSACPLYYPSNKVIAFTAGSAGFAARIHGPVLSFQAIKRGNLFRGFLFLIPVSSRRN